MPKSGKDPVSVDPKHAGTALTSSSMHRIASGHRGISDDSLSTTPVSFPNNQQVPSTHVVVTGFLVVVARVTEREEEEREDDEDEDEDEANVGVVNAPGALPAIPLASVALNDQPDTQIKTSCLQNSRGGIPIGVRSGRHDDRVSLCPLRSSARRTRCECTVPPLV
jgi:hypothetical protein